MSVETRAHHFEQWCLKHGWKQVTKPQRDKRRWRRERFERWFKKEPKEINDKREYYRSVYLKSNHWKALKACKLRHNPYCEECGADYLLDVHHINYRNLYDVQLNDLKTLCRGCHNRIHLSEYEQ